MVSKLIAFVMALLVGNPMCCCAMANLFADDVENPPKFHPCCGLVEHTDDKQQEPEKPDSCSCFLKADKASPEIQPSLCRPSHDGSDQDDLPKTEYSAFLPHLPIAVLNVSKWPPGSLPVLLLRERLALKNSYLL
ncbi:MAG: hypothetical protein ACON5H_06575 [Akkermansiaceae bacterium]